MIPEANNLSMDGFLITPVQVSFFNLFLIHSTAVVDCLRACNYREFQDISCCWETFSREPLRHISITSPFRKHSRVSWRLPRLSTRARERTRILPLLLRSRRRSSSTFPYLSTLSNSHSSHYFPFCNLQNLVQPIRNFRREYKNMELEAPGISKQPGSLYIFSDMVIFLTTADQLFVMFHAFNKVVDPEVVPLGTVVCLIIFPLLQIMRFTRSLYRMHHHEDQYLPKNRPLYFYYPCSEPRSAHQRHHRHS